MMRNTLNGNTIKRLIDISGKNHNKQMNESPGSDNTERRISLSRLGVLLFEIIPNPEFKSRFTL
jgi:hypothetical protein